MHKKVLFVGCSHTAHSGFSDDNAAKFHWPWLFCNEHNYYFQNAAIGGCSNEEIFYRTVEHTQNTKFDLVIVMWSKIDRKWIYFEDHNVDDFTLINNGVPGGNRCNEKLVKDYAKIHYSTFNNQYVSLKHWLLQTISLAALLQQQETKFIFVKGYENYVGDIFNSIHVDTRFVITPDMKKLLHFNSNPDYYIREKLNVLKHLADTANKPYWFNFTQPAFSSLYYKLDSADDNMHCGPESNKKFYSAFSNFYKTYSLSV